MDSRQRKGQLISRREFLKLNAALLASLALAGVRDAKAEQKPPTSGYRYGLTNLPTKSAEFFLTIDDGWDPDALEKMVDLLKAAGRQATFFLVGYAAQVIEQKKKGLLNRLVDEGSNIGYHTLTHRHSSQIARRDLGWFLRDHSAWLKLMQNLLGRESAKAGLPPLARPPGGYFGQGFIAMCNTLELAPISWKQTTDSVSSGSLLKSGDILLMHVTHRDTILLENYLKNLDKIAGGGITPAAIKL
jgi:peptidoglycan/xylan/chitin deacetylase (PgdA/CDA1 family)